MKKLLKQQDGFSLIELLVAITIFAVGLLAVAGMQTTSVIGNFTSRAVTEGTEFGLGKVEELLSLPYDHTDLANGAHAAVVDGIYSYTWTVTENDRLSNTKTILVNVTWTNHGVSHVTDLTFVKADTI